MLWGGVLQGIESSESKHGDEEIGGPAVVLKYGFFCFCFCFFFFCFENVKALSMQSWM